jgi:hypothetical protein
MGLDGWAKSCGVGHVRGSKIFDATSAQQAGMEAIQQATRGQRPDLIIMCASVEFEEHVLAGINKVCEGVRIFGSTSGNDSLVGGAQDKPWQLYGSLAGWGAICDGGVVLLAIWQSPACNVHNVLAHCFGVTEHTGMVTSAEDRQIFQIDGRPAADVLLEWTGLSLPCAATTFAEYALAFEEKLVDIKGIGEEGQLHCFASTASELGSTPVHLVHIKASSALGEIRELARNAKNGTGFEVKAALIVICAGICSLLSGEDLQKMESTLKEVAPEVFVVSSFGEQGNSHSGHSAFHGNNMVNFLFFG